MDLVRQQAHSNEDMLKECEKSYNELKKMLEQQFSEWVDKENSEWVDKENSSN